MTVKRLRVKLEFGYQKLILSGLRGPYLLFVFVFVFVSVASAQAATDCPPEKGLALQVLGSGGPIADDARASSAYLLWQDRKARVLIDIGAGSLLRFAESGARFADLEAILLTHLHADHASDLPGLLKSGYFSDRSRPILIAGPAAGGNGQVYFPALDAYLNALFDARQGAYAYLSDYLPGEGGDTPLLPAVIGPMPWNSGPLDQSSNPLTIKAIPVSHGPVPAVAYRVETAGQSVVFAGDQDGQSRGFPQFAKSATLLVMHLPIPEGAGAAALALHAPPSRIGEIAREAGPAKLVLSHFMRRSLRDLDGNLDQVRRRYQGPVIAADDLDCVEIP